MNNEQTNKSDTDGAKDNKPVEKPKENLSPVEQAKETMESLKAENDRREEIIKQEQKLESDRVLAGTSGGHIEPKMANPAKEMADEIVSAFN